MKPLRALILMVLCCDEPCTMVRLDGLALREKSGVGAVTVTIMLVVLVSGQLMPSTWTM